MIDYDSKVIYRYANQLHKQANRITAAYAFVGTVIGLLISIFAVQGVDSGAAPYVIAVFSVVGLLIGKSIGGQKAFKLKLEAQLALCQVQIEENTAAQIVVSNP